MCVGAAKLNKISSNVESFDFFTGGIYETATIRSNNGSNIFHATSAWKKMALIKMFLEKIRLKFLILILSSQTVSEPMQPEFTQPEERLSWSFQFTAWCEEWLCSQTCN